MTYGKSYRAYLRQSDLPEQLTPVCRSVEVPVELIPIINAHLAWLTQNWMWFGSEQQRSDAITAINALIEQLADKKCEFPPVEVPVEIFRDRFIEVSDCEECEDMACNCIKQIRWKNGVLQVSYQDDKSCSDCWFDVIDAPVSLPDDTAGDYLFDEDDRAREGRKIRLKKPKVNQDKRLAACAKATALVDSIFDFGLAIVGAKSSIIDIIDSIIPVEIIWELIKGFLPPEVQALAEVPELVATALGLSEDELQEFSEFATEDMRKTLICELTKQVSAEAEIVGEDIQNLMAIAVLNGLQHAEIILRIFRSFDVLAVTELFSKKVENLDCGCPDITGENAGQEPPETYDWCYEFDFTQNAEGWGYRYNGATPEGEYAVGVGHKAIENSNYTRLTMSRSAISRILTGIDAHYKNITLGNYQEGEGYSGLPNRNFNIYSGETFYFSSNITAGEKVWRWRGHKSVEDLQIMLTLAYDAIEPTTRGGSATLTRLTLYGIGTNPFGADNCE